jgi:hypothetical protein
MTVELFDDRGRTIDGPSRAWEAEGKVVAEWHVPAGRSVAGVDMTDAEGHVRFELIREPFGRPGTYRITEARGSRLAEALLAFVDT